MVYKSTETYANHGTSLKCDIYTDNDYPKDAPVFLYFHPGGLVHGNRDLIAPWLVQTCIQRKWPLISPTYRLLPQARGEGLLEDASAAYEFARNWNTLPGSQRRVIVGGASAGFFMAALIAHHCEPKPLALLSIQGINTFRHPFFNSSLLLTEQEIAPSAMEEFITGPMQSGDDMRPHEAAFVLDKLTADGAKNPDYSPSEMEPDTRSVYRGMLYDYYLYNNSFVDLVGSVDAGYQWAKLAGAKERVAQWPKTVIFHGNNDPDVELSVSEDMRDCLGDDRVTLIVADGQPHSYELVKFIEDDGSGMDVVRQSVARLDEIVAAS
ncbi:Alpha/Beta hydrolase protein [Trichoderma austrokoningii]